MTQPQTTITVYTDGTCKGNPGPGSWAAIIEDKHKWLHIAGRVSHTTSQKMELTAAIKALEALAKHVGRPIRLVTNSMYLVDGMTMRRKNWKTHGWNGATGKPLVNHALWARLDELSNEHDITWVWVSAQKGSPGNAQANALANEALTRGVVQKRGSVVLPPSTIYLS